MKFKPGVKYGEELRDLYAYAKENEFAFPAVNFPMVELSFLQEKALRMISSKLLSQVVFPVHTTCIRWQKPTEFL